MPLLTKADLTKLSSKNVYAWAGPWSVKVAGTGAQEAPLGMICLGQYHQAVAHQTDEPSKHEGFIARFRNVTVMYFVIYADGLHALSELDTFPVYYYDFDNYVTPLNQVVGSLEHRNPREAKAFLKRCVKYYEHALQDLSAEWLHKIQCREEPLNSEDPIEPIRR
jgi:hypothetical protein